MNFEKLPSGYSYLLVSEGEDVREFKIKEVTDEVSAQNWIAKISEETKITWRALRTYPETNGKYNIFKKDLRCQHATDKRAKGVGPSINTNCPATFRILVKRYIEKSRSKKIDPLTKDWPTTCVFKNAHNHAIESAAVLQCRPLSETSKEILRSLFHKGHYASSALQCLKTDLLLEHGDNFYKISSDGFYVPSLSVATKLFQKEFVEIYGELKGPKMFECLEKQLNDYSSSSTGKAEYHRTEDGEHYFVVLLTPIMLRVHQHIIQSKELILVDASGGVDKLRHRIYFLVCPTTAGGLPAGVIICDTEKESVFHEALICFKMMLGDVAFFGATYPEVFLTDNDLKERKPLAKLFPKSKLLLCQFHFLKSVWSWLCNKKHTIKDTERQQLYFFVKNILYAQDEDKFFKSKDLLMSSDVWQKNPNFQRYFDILWSQKSDWASYFRKNLPVRGNNTTNYVEVVFRILKDTILNRIMAFNLNQLVDFILTRYEAYMQKRLIDFVNGRVSKSLLHKMLLVENDILGEDIELMDNNLCYTVKSQTAKDREYFVDVCNGICSCFVGQNGSICKHASAVIMQSTDKLSTAYNLVCPTVKEKIFLVATGNSVSSEWLMPLNQQPAINAMECLEESKSNESSGLINWEPSSSNQSSDFNMPEDIRATNNEIKNKQKCEKLSADDLEEFDGLVSRMKQGCKTDPEIYVPAMKKMLKNARTAAATQNGLVSAMHTFGLYNGAGKTLNKQRHHGKHIGVQPTAIRRRKSLLAGKRKLSAGRPVQSAKVPKELHSHDYTSFGCLPTRKLKAPHNLQSCVYDNKSLGGRK